MTAAASDLPPYFVLPPPHFIFFNPARDSKKDPYAGLLLVNTVPTGPDCSMLVPVPPTTQVYRATAVPTITSGMKKTHHFIQREPGGPKRFLVLYEAGTAISPLGPVPILAIRGQGISAFLPKCLKRNFEFEVVPVSAPAPLPVPSVPIHPAPAKAVNGTAPQLSDLLPSLTLTQLTATVTKHLVANETSPDMIELVTDAITTASKGVDLESLDKKGLRDLMDSSIALMEKMFAAKKTAGDLNQMGAGPVGAGAGAGAGAGNGAGAGPSATTAPAPAPAPTAPAKPPRKQAAPKPTTSTRLHPHVARQLFELAQIRHTECPIIAEELSEGNTAVMPCGHLFSRLGIDESLKKDPGRCPACRTNGYPAYV
jgi:hypothetical protein